MHNIEEQTTIEHDAIRDTESDEARAERTPVVRLLANPRRVRRD